MLEIRARMEVRGLYEMFRNPHVGMLEIRTCMKGRELCEMFKNATCLVLEIRTCADVRELGMSGVRTCRCIDVQEIGRFHLDRLRSSYLKNR